MKCHPLCLHDTVRECRCRAHGQVCGGSCGSSAPMRVTLPGRPGRACARATWRRSGVSLECRETGVRDGTGQRPGFSQRAFPLSLLFLLHHGMPPAFVGPRRRCPSAKKLTVAFGNMSISVPCRYLCHFVATMLKVP